MKRFPGHGFPEAAMLPALFVSHGSPMIAIEPTPAHHFLRGLGERLPRPRAILVATAHWTTAEPTVGTAARPETIHDFGGFPEALYQLRYPAPGAPEVAERAAALIEAAGMRVGRDPERGLDHGTWIPLLLMYPKADIPVAQIAVQPHRDPAHHARLGAALRPLRDEGVLIIGSGTFTHNLRAAFTLMRAGRAEAELPFTEPFVAWIAERVAAGYTEALLAYRERAPFARENHPTDEHFLPFFVALGAGTPGKPGERWHQSRDWGMAMDCFAFP
jgi:4,5-DOPA dioxygenase extradiol